MIARGQRVRVTLHAAPTHAKDASGASTRTDGETRTVWGYLDRRSAVEIDRGGGREAVGDYRLTLHYIDAASMQSISTVTGDGSADNPLGSQTAKVVDRTGGRRQGRTVTLGVLTQQG